MSAVTTVGDVERFESRLLYWGVPKQIADQITEYNTQASYTPGSIIFCQDSPADIFFWVVKGIAKVSCCRVNGERSLVQLATPGELLCSADTINDAGHWMRRFEAQAVSKCVLAMITRQHLREIMKTMDSQTILDFWERTNSAWAKWIHYYAELLSMGFRERLELVLADVGRKFGIEDSEGILLTYGPRHSDLAEMIGSSRPLVSRLFADLVEGGEIGRRGRQYLLLKGGVIADMAANPRLRSPGQAIAQPGNGTVRRARVAA
jgi:CRP-like cAMP-binding protein